MCVCEFWRITFSTEICGKTASALYGDSKEQYKPIVWLDFNQLYVRLYAYFSTFLSLRHRKSSVPETFCFRVCLSVSESESVRPEKLWTPSTAAYSTTLGVILCSSICVTERWALRCLKRQSGFWVHCNIVILTFLLRVSRIRRRFVASID